MTKARTETVRDAFRAYQERDRELIESIIGDPFEFHAPPDPSLDRAGYFERCWPNASHLEEFEIVRLVESGDEVIVTYEARRSDGGRFRNTEVHRFDGEQVAEVEVYFGWDLE